MDNEHTHVVLIVDEDGYTIAELRTPNANAVAVALELINPSGALGRLYVALLPS